jgi:site-specific DNA-cytosine methylase
MRVLVACEFSGTVRDAFSKLGHDVISCDLEPTDNPGNHYQGDVFDIINDGFDLMVAFPPCTHLAVSGAKHFEEKRKDGRQQKGVDFFLEIAKANIPKIAIENPIGIMSGIYRKPDQIVQPYHFGDPVKKTTCLWLKNLPLLKTTNDVSKDVEYYTSAKGAKMSAWYAKQIVIDGKKYGYNTKEFKKHRSTTFLGLANAMAEQWGSL